MNKILLLFLLSFQVYADSDGKVEAVTPKNLLPVGTHVVFNMRHMRYRKICDGIGEIVGYTKNYKNYYISKVVCAFDDESAVFKVPKEYIVKVIKEENE